MDPIVPLAAMESNASFMRFEIVVVQTVVRNAKFIGIVPGASIFPGPLAECVLVGALCAKGAYVQTAAMGDVEDSIVVFTGMDARKFTTVRFAPFSACVNITNMPVDKVAL